MGQFSDMSPVSLADIAPPPFYWLAGDFLQLAVAGLAILSAVLLFGLFYRRRRQQISEMHSGKTADASDHSDAGEADREP